MKKYLIILIIPLIFSCDKIFHEEDIEYIVLDTYSEKVDMVNGMYTNLIKVHNQNYFELLCRSDDINHMMYYVYDHCAGGGYQIDYNTIKGNIYKYLYIAIINANSLIKQVNENENPELLGEIYFLRAYCYFKLARFFGTSPLVTDIDVNYNIKKPSYREVYEFIEADLLKAIEYLPDTYTNSRILYETPHDGTAKALLAEVYLSMAGFPVNDKSKYALAASLSGDIIENADYYGINLLNDFADLWKEEYRHNNENIFGLFFKLDKQRPERPFRSIFSDGDFNASTEFNSLGLNLEMIANFKFFNSYPDNYRKFTTMRTGAYRNRELALKDTVINIIYFHKFDLINEPCNYLNGFRCLKWIDQKASITFPEKVIYNTIYLLRYAQTLLTYAEAKGHLGEIDESAYKAVNMIRRRANKLDINTPSIYDLQANLTKEQFLDSVVWERAWELFYEPDGRWFDIIRLDLKDKLPEYIDSLDAPTVIDDRYLTNDWYFYKIPKEDRWLNPNLEEEE